MSEGGSSSGQKGKVVREVAVENQLGFHARPAALFAKVASRFDSDIVVENGRIRVSGKSLMGLLGLQAGHGCVIRITAEGVDAEEAVDELVQLVKDKFGYE